MIEVSEKLKEKVREALLRAFENYGGSATKFSRRYGINNTVFSEIKNGKTENKLSATKWLNIAAMLGVSTSERIWKMARTEVFDVIEQDVMFCQQFSQGMIFVDKCAIGKTYSALYLSRTLKNCFYVDASLCKTKILFARSLAQAIGIDGSGRYTDVKLRIRYALNALEKPIVIIDEAGDLEYNAFLDVKEYQNGTTNRCGWYMIGANGLRKKINDGIARESVGYEEIFSRLSDSYSHVVPSGKDDQISFYRKLLTDVLSVNMSDQSKLNTIVNQCLTVSTGNTITGLRRAEKLLILNS